MCYTAPAAESGGCGTGHGRPVVNGAPVRIWALACPPCETYLLSVNDPCWARHPEKIPLSPDERLDADKLEKQGTSQMAKVAEAIAMNADRLLRDQREDDIVEAARMAEVTQAAEYERRAAEAERRAAEAEARLREAERVARSFEIAAGRAESAAVTPPARSVLEKAVTITPESPVKGIPDFPVEIHPSRKCAGCGLSVTRRAHSAGRWPNQCLSCREGARAA